MFVLGGLCNVKVLATKCIEVLKPYGPALMIGSVEIARLLRPHNSRLSMLYIAYGHLLHIQGGP